ncbi:unnamed protein product [Schistosoma mattheei]|uniref:Uncharacterized protein n=1 Tax=Schistosoma mattheei TaxID=31246 RepID=A0A183Q7Z0_9TREM|nr:unnamed protein product [Schistosoma mattheei]
MLNNWDLTDLQINQYYIIDIYGERQSATGVLENKTVIVQLNVLCYGLFRQNNTEQFLSVYIKFKFLIVSC